MWLESRTMESRPGNASILTAEFLHSAKSPADANEPRRDWRRARGGSRGARPASIAAAVLLIRRRHVLPCEVIVPDDLRVLAHGPLDAAIALREPPAEFVDGRIAIDADRLGVLA